MEIERGVEYPVERYCMRGGRMARQRFSNIAAVVGKGGNWPNNACA